MRKAGSRVRVTVQLVDAAKGFQIWSERYDRELADIFDVQDEITRAIVRRLKVALAIEDADRLVKVTTTNMEAYQAYLKGRAHAVSEGALDRPCARESQEGCRARSSDTHRRGQASPTPTQCCATSGERRPEEAMPAALDAATRALEIDPESAEAHNALACASLLWERDFKKAEREFLQALALNPNYIQARCWYGLFFLQWTVGAVRRRSRAGLAGIRGPIRSPPTSRWSCPLRWPPSGAFEEALIYAKTAVEQDPQSFVGRWELAFAHRWNGQYDEALALLETLWTESPVTWIAMQLVPTYAKLGRLEQARVIYDELLARRDHEYVPPFALAICASGLADHEAALTFSAAAVEGRDVLLGALSFVDTRPRSAPRRSPLRPPGRAIQRAEALVVGSRSGRRRLREPPASFSLVIRSPSTSPTRYDGRDVL